MKNLFLRILIFIVLITNTFVLGKIPTREELNELHRIKDSFPINMVAKKTTGRASYLPENYTTESGRFKIHYALTGNHGVENTSTNSYGIPDYIYETAISADKAYHILVDSLGFDPPPSDNDIDGPEIDIYVKEFGGSVYAYTYPENLVTSTTRANDWTSYLEIDNNYDESTYSTHGIDGMRVTVVHEFFHMIQLGYNYDTSNYLSNMSNGDTFFFEWCAVWFEDFCYPDINDYIQYTADLLYYPGYSIWNYDYWYANGAFIKFIVDKYSADIMLKTWERIKSKTAFYALKEIIKEETSETLAELWNEFCQKMYFTGDRYSEEFSVSEDAKLFPKMEISIANQLEYLNPLNIEDNVRPFSCIPIQVDFDLKQHFGLKNNSDFSKDFLGNYVFDKGYKITLDEFTLNSEKYIGQSKSNDKLFLFITNKNYEESLDFQIKLAEFDDPSPIKILSYYPNPINLSLSSLTIQLKISESALDFKFELFNLLGHKIYTEKINTIQSNVYNLNLREKTARNLASGIYFMRISAGKHKTVKKITIIK